MVLLQVFLEKFFRVHAARKAASLNSHSVEYAVVLRLRLGPLREASRRTCSKLKVCCSFFLNCSKCRPFIGSMHSLRCIYTFSTWMNLSGCSRFVLVRIFSSNFDAPAFAMEPFVLRARVATRVLFLLCSMPHIGYMHASSLQRCATSSCAARWRTYLTAGSSSLYLFLYAAFYFFTKLDITKLVSGILYIGYMLIISYSFFALTGTMGFYACYWFVSMIYAP